MNGSDLRWNVMLEELAGAKFSTFGLYQVAELQTGKVIGSQTYELLTQRLYEKSSTEKFADL
jgi:hypothetical protein